MAISVMVSVKKQNKNKKVLTEKIEIVEETEKDEFVSKRLKRKNKK